MERYEVSDCQNLIFFNNITIVMNLNFLLKNDDDAYGNTKTQQPKRQETQPSACADCYGFDNSNI